MNKSLYELLGMKRKNSIFKSVFITNRRTHDGLPIVEVEPYDQTFLNAISTVKKYDDTTDRIIRKVYEYFKGGEIWLSIYTDEYGQDDILVNDYYVNFILN